LALAAMFAFTWSRLMTDFRALCVELHAAFTTYAVDECHHNLLERARAALAEHESGIPKNCWLDEDPGLCPSPCVFDDPNDHVCNCMFATKLEADSKPKTDCKYYRQ
jgi:hypothetical protein